MDRLYDEHALMLTSMHDMLVRALDKDPPRDAKAYRAVLAMLSKARDEFKVLVDQRYTMQMAFGERMEGRETPADEV